MGVPKITLYVDIVSPFAYIAFHILKVRQGSNNSCRETLTTSQNSPTFAKVDVNYVPILLGGLMHACGNSPPITIKSEYSPAADHCKSRGYCTDSITR